MLRVWGVQPIYKLFLFPPLPSDTARRPPSGRSAGWTCCWANRTAGVWTSQGCVEAGFRRARSTVSRPALIHHPTSAHSGAKKVHYIPACLPCSVSTTLVTIVLYTNGLLSRFIYWASWNISSSVKGPIQLISCTTSWYGSLRFYPSVSTHTLVKILQGAI